MLRIGSRQPDAVFRPHDREATEDLYEQLVNTSSQGSIYCHRWWLDAVAPGRYRILTIKHKPSLLAAWPIVTEESGGRINVVMPLMTQKLGILFAQPRAKYAESLSQQHTLCAELIAQLPGPGSFRQSFHEAFTNWLPFHWRGFEQTTRYTYILTNIKDHDSLWKEMRHRIRTNINKAARHGLRIVDDVEFDELAHLNDKVFERQGLEPAVPRALLARLDEACCAHAGRQILAARDKQERVHAAAYIVWDNGTAYYLLAGSDPMLRESGALALASWEAIKFASTVADTFDCEGSMIPGVEYVFRNLGARQYPYFAISKAAPPTLWLRGKRKVVCPLCRRLRFWHSCGS